MSPADQVAADLADRLEIEKRYRAGIALALERGEEFYNRTQHLVDIALKQEKRRQAERRAVLTDDVLNLSMRDRLSGSDLPALLVRFDFPILSAYFHALNRGLDFCTAEWSSRHILSDHCCCAAHSRSLGSKFQRPAWGWTSDEAYNDSVSQCVQIS